MFRRDKVTHTHTHIFTHAHCSFAEFADKNAAYTIFIFIVSRPLLNNYISIVYCDTLMVFAMCVSVHVYTWPNAAGHNVSVFY